jgi:lipopolysaccharide transport system ATP-binding protein
MKPIIKVENLGKRYYLGACESVVPTLRETFTGSLNNMLKRLSRREASTDQAIWALSDVGFEVSPGEVVGIIGRNGAGKSTLLKILSRITKPTTGMVDLYGRAGSLLEVGTGFHPDLTGRENIYLNGAILGMKREEIKRNFDEIVAFAQIDPFLDTPVKRYSSGMYLRLAFAVAAHLEPEILILDEVLTVGDAQFQKKCLGKMEEVGRQGRTVLFVSHNMASVQQLCGRVLYISSGVLLEDGKPETVISSYLKDISDAEDNGPPL